MLKFCRLRGFMKMWILPLRQHSLEASGDAVPDHSHAVAGYHACQWQFVVVSEQAYPVQSLAMAEDQMLPGQQPLLR